MNIEEASNYFKLIADPNRLTILNLLTKKLHMSGNEILSYVTCKQATLSHHLSELTESGLLNSKKSGNKTLYSINASKYGQLANFLDKIDRINKNIDNPVRVSESNLIKNIEDKTNNIRQETRDELPDFLL